MIQTALPFQQIMKALNYSDCQFLEALKHTKTQTKLILEKNPQIELLEELELCYTKENTYVISPPGKDFLKHLFEDVIDYNNSGKKYEIFLQQKTIAHNYMYQTGKRIIENINQLGQYSSLQDTTSYVPMKNKVFISDGIIDESILIEAKFQSSSGTAEEKIADKIFRIGKIMLENTQYKKAYVIFGGDGWSQYTLLRSREIKDSFKDICDLDINIVTDNQYCQLLSSNSL